jgi:hypothetical protein
LVFGVWRRFIVYLLPFYATVEDFNKVEFGFVHDFIEEGFSDVMGLLGIAD